MDVAPSTYPGVKTVSDSLNLTSLVLAFSHLVQGHDSPVLVCSRHLDNSRSSTVEVALHQATHHIGTVVFLHKDGVSLALVADLDAGGILVIVFVTYVAIGERDSSSHLAIRFFATEELHDLDRTAVNQGLNEGVVCTARQVSEDDGANTGILTN